MTLTLIAFSIRLFLSATIELDLVLDAVIPRPTECWRSADSEILPEEKPCLHLVPPLDVFTKVEDLLQLKRFVFVWRKVSAAWFRRVSEELQPPDFSTRRAWRTFMRGSFDLSPLRPESEAGKSRLRFAGYLDLPEPPKFNIDQTFFNCDPPKPLDKTVDVQVIKSVLFKVAQVNFFHDVYEVELKRTWDLPSVVLERLQPITGSSNYFLDPAPVTFSTIEDRVKWLLAFRDVVSPWPSSFQKSKDFDIVPRRSSDKAALKVQDVTALELALARFYCHTAQEILGQRPTIPLYKPS